MQLILKPIGHPELGEIIVNDTLFAVGRHEKPFDGYDPRLVTRLSRRHARIFEQNGVIYLADLGSLNGTTVDGQAVGTAPVILRAGAEICFAGLCYQVEILGAAASQALQHSDRTLVALVLKPQDPGSGLEPIVVSEFPFLINKRDEVFARYGERWPDELQYLSRRHAHIFVRENSPYIEDLGSTNGTYVRGVRIEEHARPLTNGDVVAFGGTCFVYDVELVHRDATVAKQPLDPTHVGISDSTRTTFVTSASSFLEIFCTDDGSDGDGAPDAKLSAGGEKLADKGRGSVPSGRGWFARASRLRSSLGEVRQALADDTPARPRLRMYFGLTLLAAAAIAAAVYVTNATPWRIEAMAAAGRYQEAAEEANAFLELTPRTVTCRTRPPMPCSRRSRRIGPSW